MTNTGNVADLLDLGAALADEGAALRGGHDEPQRDGGAGPTATTLVELRAPLEQYNEPKGLVHWQVLCNGRTHMQTHRGCDETVLEACGIRSVLASEQHDFYSM
ncbi:hypothetical protein HW555_009630 [Spodoptera exigua]|uniref:Uncharacterized protein n=1 Tax=Spodoptera exigua TaxID=7107 RepID=A0A835L3C5_SPOEX|nr:hypothetical protein HW555_009630 [Spodoptera exigua]